MAQDQANNEDMEIAAENELEQGDSGLDQSAIESAFTGASTASREPAAPAAEVAPAAQAIPAATNAASDPYAALRKQVADLGLKTNGTETPEQLSEALINQLRTMQPMAQYAQQVMPHADDFNRYLESQKNPQPQAPQEPEQEWTEESYFQDKYGGPTWKSEFQNAIEQGIVMRDPDTGLWTSAPGAEIMAANILGDMNAAQQHSSSFWQKLSQGNPYQEIYGAVKEPLLKEVEALVAQTLRQREQQSNQTNYVSSFEDNNASWLYEIDPTTGSQVPTERGNQFFDAIDEIKADGITDPEKVLKYAMKMVGPPPPAQAPPAVEPVQQQAQQQPEPKKSFLEGALERAKHSPSASVSAADAPQAVTSGDLESIFVRAQRASHN